MKYQRADRFKRDCKRLSSERYERLRAVAVEQFAPAAERRAQNPGEAWPKALRVKDVEGHAGIWEMTWDWPDGRATFEWIEIEGEPAIRWRRAGTHAIFREP